MQFSILHIYWLFFVVLGMLVDARLWNKKEDDPAWLRNNFSWFWLILFPATFWFSQDAGWFLKDYYVAQYGSWAYVVFKLHSLMIGFGTSVIWDLGYSKIEKGKWIAPLALWLTIPYFWKKEQKDTDRLIIGFTESQMWYLNGFRIIVLILSLFI